MGTSTATLDGVKQVIVKVLSIEDRMDTLVPSTSLFGGIPEFDSLAVVELAAALEEHFAITIDDGDFTGDVFETVGSLAAFVEARLSRS